MAPPKGRHSPDKPVSTGMPGEWETAQNERTVRRNRQPQKSVLADVSAATGLLRQGQSKGAGSAGSS
eukprot:11769220-Alexandrium_andersonii.AAC.1